MSTQKQAQILDITGYNHCKHYYQYGQYGCNRKAIKLNEIVPSCGVTFTGVVETCKGDVLITGAYSHTGTHNEIKVENYELIDDCTFDMEKLLARQGNTYTCTCDYIKWGQLTW